LSNLTTMKILTTREFLESLTHLLGNYPSVFSDIAPVIDQIKKGNTPGDRVQGVGGRVIYKVRVPNRDAQRGKSGGYRLLYYLVDEKRRLLLNIYSKSVRADISSDELTQILKDWEAKKKDS
jgi:mRNA-degrading endonuclease RelE of RelBE toxin-antitoxin system